MSFLRYGLGKFRCCIWKEKFASVYQSTLAWYGQVWCFGDESPKIHGRRNKFRGYPCTRVHQSRMTEQFTHAWMLLGGRVTVPRSRSFSDCALCLSPSRWYAGVPSPGGDHKRACARRQQRPPDHHCTRQLCVHSRVSRDSEQFHRHTLGHNLCRSIRTPLRTSKLDIQTVKLPRSWKWTIQHRLKDATDPSLKSGVVSACLQGHTPNDCGFKL